MKTIKFTAKGSKWELVETRLNLSDTTDGFGGDYNHPRIWLKLRRCGTDGDYSGDWLSFEIEFQRNSPKLDNVTGRPVRAEGYMDTGRPWGPAYGGHIELTESYRVSSHHWSGPFKLDEKDQIKMKIVRKLAKIVSERNLFHVHRDECMQIIAALEVLGCHVEKLYITPGQDPLPAVHAEGRGASRRWAEEQEAA